MTARIIFEKMLYPTYSLLYGRIVELYNRKAQATNAFPIVRLNGFTIVHQNHALLRFFRSSFYIHHFSTPSSGQVNVVNLPPHKAMAGRLRPESIYEKHSVLADKENEESMGGQNKF